VLAESHAVAVHQRNWHLVEEADRSSLDLRRHAAADGVAIEVGRNDASGARTSLGGAVVRVARVKPFDAMLDGRGGGGATTGEVLDVERRHPVVPPARAARRAWRGRRRAA
jgi:hypothetical protein